MYQYSRTTSTETFKTQYHFRKFTQERTRECVLGVRGDPGQVVGLVPEQGSRDHSTDRLTSRAMSVGHGRDRRPTVVPTRTRLGRSTHRTASTAAHRGSIATAGVGRNGWLLHRMDRLVAHWTPWVPEHAHVVGGQHRFARLDRSHTVTRHGEVPASMAGPVGTARRGKFRPASRT